ncbi:hypothetical protein BDQ12DRAFT_665468 [Crucibulum laeve]|uniref:Uncharacterized protein n=1 Tax=Crucibulum laeve TaxID=68775 RepID=A0A5C3M115_9AGAR|nr:hypothetical protein BDQ12DRAFT_665468 [Crucibulum laeve]
MTADSSVPLLPLPPPSLSFVLAERSSTLSSLPPNSPKTHVTPIVLGSNCPAFWLERSVVSIHFSPPLAQHHHIALMMTNMTNDDVDQWEGCMEVTLEIIHMPAAHHDTGTPAPLHHSAGVPVPYHNTQMLPPAMMMMASDDAHWQQLCTSIANNELHHSAAANDNGTQRRQ